MSHQQHSASTPHITPLWVYLGVGATLLIFTAITVGVALIDLNKLLGVHHLNIIIAMLIATFKGALVALFFMHLFWDNKIYMLAFVIGLVCLGIFISLTMFDTMRRGDIYSIEGGTIKPQVEYTYKPSHGEEHATEPAEGSAHH